MTLPKPRPPLNPGETRAYPVLPLRDIVVFPHMIVPLFVGREKSIKALEEVMRSDTFILLATQKNASDDDPATDTIYETGTLASMRHLTRTSIQVDLAGPATGLDALPGVHDLQTHNGTARFDVDTAALDAVLRQLTTVGVRSLTSQPPTLEELFLRHYDRAPADANHRTGVAR